MVTFKAIIIPGNRRKDGTHPVNIRVTFKGKSRRLATTLICTPSDVTRTGKIKDATILNKADAIIAEMRDAIKDISPFDLDNQDVDWVVTHIKDALSKSTFHLDFFEWADKYLVCKTRNTRNIYYTALNSLERYLGKRSLDINDISRSMLLDYVDHIDAEPKLRWDNGVKGVILGNNRRIPKAASTRYIAKLEHIFNAAKDRYNDEDAGRILIPRSPFVKIARVYPVSQGQGNLGVELMQKIISAQTDNRYIRFALDIFIISFGLMGANMADLYQARPFRGRWIYNRAKTRTRRADRAEMRVDVPPQLQQYLGRIQGKGEWWLNVLHDSFTCTNGATSAVNRQLRTWCEQNGIPAFTFYAARHTWASLCRNECKVDKSTIDDCLGHKGDYAVTDIYAERAWDVMQDANNKVLSLFTWE